MEKRSRIIAASNFLNAAFMVTTSVLTVLLLKLRFKIPQILLIGATLNLLVTMYIFTLVPEFLMRFCCWILVNLLYRVKGYRQFARRRPGVEGLQPCWLYRPVIIAGGIPRPTVIEMYWEIFQAPGANRC